MQGQPFFVILIGEPPARHGSGVQSPRDLVAVCSECFFNMPLFFKKWEGEKRALAMSRNTYAQENGSKRKKAILGYDE